MANSGLDPIQTDDVTLPVVATVVSRRISLFSLISGLGLLSIHEQADAGAQVEEPLMDAVRTALSSAISNHAPPVPEFADTIPPFLSADR